MKNANLRMRHPAQRVKQTVYSAPRRIKGEKYLTPKGQFLFIYAKTKKEKEEIWSKYGKVRYRKNPDAVCVKTIYHFPQV